jgi:hypothetical protein
VGRGAQERFYFLAAWDVAFADAVVVGAENARGALHLLRLAFNFEVVVFQVRGDAQRRLKELEVFIQGAEEFVDSSGDSNGLFHPVGRNRKLA